MRSVRRLVVRGGAGLAVLTMLGGCGTGPQPAGSTTPGATPVVTPSSLGSLSGASSTVTAFMQALRAHDCAAAYALVTDPLRSAARNAAGLCAAQVAAPTYTVGTPTALSDTSAFAAVTLNSGAQATLETVTLLYQGGHWLVSGVNTNGATGAGAGASPGSPGSNVTATIAQQYSAQNGGAVATITCPPPPDTGYPPGDQFQCSFTDSNGRTGTMTVSIGSSSGAFTWTIP